MCRDVRAANDHRDDRGRELSLARASPKRARPERRGRRPIGTAASSAGRPRFSARRRGQGPPGYSVSMRISIVSVEVSTDSVPAGTRGRHPAPAVAHGGPARRGRRCPGPGRGRAGAPVRRTGIGSGASACSCPQPNLVWQDPVWTTLLSITNRTMTCNSPMPASLRSARSRSSSWLTTSSSWACSSNDARGFGLRDTLSNSSARVGPGGLRRLGAPSPGRSGAAGTAACHPAPEVG